MSDGMGMCLIQQRQCIGIRSGVDVHGGQDPQDEVSWSGLVVLEAHRSDDLLDPDQGVALVRSKGIHGNPFLGSHQPGPLLKCPRGRRLVGPLQAPEQVHHEFRGRVAPQLERIG